MLLHSNKTIAHFNERLQKYNMYKTTKQQQQIDLAKELLISFEIQNS